MRYFDFTQATKEMLAKATTFEQQLSARTTVGREQFVRAVANAGLHLLGPEDSLDLGIHPDALVVGVATWSNPDMELLDATLKYLNSRKGVFIFDVDTRLSIEDLDKVIPHCPPPMKTPVVVEYVDGALTFNASGKDACARLRLLAHKAS